MWGQGVHVEMYIVYTSKHENENTVTMSSESAHTFRGKSLQFTRKMPPIYREASHIHHCTDYTPQHQSMI